MAPSIPHFRKTATSRQLVVDDEPFLMLAGEVQNSQFSSARYMKDVWGNLKAANLNTVFGSAAWEQIEPEEGQFDWGNLDEIICDARGHGLRLVLLWFGSWKNGMSTYTPAWVKRNAKRFPRAELLSEDGKSYVGDLLSVFGEEACKADARAFAALMKHIREVDEEYSTVVMVKVENEVGLLGDSRDRSQLAEAHWRQPVPQQLIEALETQWSHLNEPFRTNFATLNDPRRAEILTWDTMPGDKLLVEELFMAFHYALYVDEVAAAGNSAYPLPLYTNVWQNYAGADRDENISTVVAGGGSPMFAPNLALIAPDVYLNDYASSCAAYRHRGQPLLIPEQRRDEYGARRIWVAYGSFQALAAAPFAIDSLMLEENPFRKHFELLSNVQRHVLAAQEKDHGSIGFCFDEIRDDGSDPSPPLKARFGDWDLCIERSFVFGKPSAGCGLIIHKAENEFLLVGWGFQVRFESTNPHARFVGLLKFEEQEVINKATGELRTLRLLNGDETRSGNFAIMPSSNPDGGDFPICITIPANTGIAVVEPYALLEDDLVRSN